MSMYFDAAANVGKTFDEIQRRRGPSRKVRVPDFVGASGTDIWLRALQGGVHARLHAAEQGSGDPVVVAQDVAAGKKVWRDTVVNLTVEHR